MQSLKRPPELRASWRQRIDGADREIPRNTERGAGRLLVGHTCTVGQFTVFAMGADDCCYERDYFTIAPAQRARISQNAAAGARAGA